MKLEEATKQEAEGPSVMSLANLWKGRLKMTYGVEKTLTPKEFGQLRQMKVGLGGLTWEVVDRVLDDWHYFCVVVRTTAGLSNSPAVPHIGFLLVHCGEAVNLMHKIAKNKKSKSTADISFISKVDEAIDRQKKELEALIADESHFCASAFLPAQGSALISATNGQDI